MTNHPGLTDLLMERQELKDLLRRTPQEGLTFLPSGRLPASAMGLLASSRMRDFLKRVREDYDWVILDSPPIMGVSDAAVLVRQAEMAVLVVQYRKYPQAMTLRARQTVEKVGGRLAGVVLNNINIAQDAANYYYSGFEYGYSNRNEPDPDPDARAPQEGAGAEGGLASKY